LHTLEFKPFRPPGRAAVELTPLSGELFHQPQARALRGMAGDTVFVAAHATPALLHS